jgi:hypothetical protein
MQTPCSIQRTLSRAAGFSSGTIWLRIGVMPRWLSFLTYLVALILLLIHQP